MQLNCKLKSQLSSARIVISTADLTPNYSLFLPFVPYSTLSLFSLSLNLPQHLPTKKGCRMNPVLNLPPPSTIPLFPLSDTVYSNILKSNISCLKVGVVIFTCRKHLFLKRPYQIYASPHWLEIDLVIFFISGFCHVSSLEMSSAPSQNKTVQPCPFSLKGNSCCICSFHREGVVV